MAFVIPVQSILGMKVKDIVTCQTRTALAKFSLGNFIVYFLLCQLAHLGVLNTVIFVPCLVAALWTGGLLETPPPWHATRHTKSSLEAPMG